MQNESSTSNRRDVLKGALAAGVVAGVGPILKAAEGQSLTTANANDKKTSAAHADLIRVENAKPGTTDWLLTNTRIDPKTKYRCPWIEGYCSRTSLRAGEPLSIMVSTNPASGFMIDIYRLGYYGGAGGRLMQKLGPFNGSVQPDPDIGPQRLRECQWEPAVTFDIPADWVSGVYVGKLTAEREGLQSYVIFIVRDDRQCDFLFQCSDSTWQAYNRWPDRFALYNDGSKNNWYTGPDVCVSWDRPYAKSSHINDLPGTQGSGEFLLWEFPLAHWMEKEGYDVSYISNLDTHADGMKLMRAKAFLSVGHDEYWSREMYDNMLAAVSGGMNAAFFSGNTCWGLVPFMPSSAGVPNRIFSRIGQFGPLEPMAVKRYPETGRFTQFAPTEANLIGARNIYPYCGVQDWICSDEKHWIYADTGMKNGDSIPNLVGWEWHGNPADIPGLSVVAKGVMTYHKDQENYTATMYPGPKDNWVFNASTIWWSDGLSAPPGYRSPSHQFPAAVGRAPENAGPRGPNPNVQKITANILNRFCGQS
jgi:hypothetical protein